MAASESELEAFIAAHRQDLEDVPGYNKLRCTVTGHELPRKLAALKAHFAGKRYTLLKKHTPEPVDLSKYEPHIVAHRRDPTKVYCRLTQSVLHNDRAEVERHVAGRRFRNILAEIAKHSKNKHVGEPDLEAAFGSGDEAPDSDEDQDMAPVDGSAPGAASHVPSGKARGGLFDDEEMNRDFGFEEVPAAGSDDEEGPGRGAGAASDDEEEQDEKESKLPASKPRALKRDESESDTEMAPASSKSPKESKAAQRAKAPSPVQSLGKRKVFSGQRQKQKNDIAVAALPKRKK